MLMFFFVCLGLVFLRKKKKGLFHTDVILHMILMVRVKQMFLNFFMLIRLKYFHDSLIIAVILTPGREFFSAKCA